MKPAFRGRDWRAVRRGGGNTLLEGAFRAKRITLGPITVIIALALVVGSARVSSVLLYGALSMDKAPLFVEDTVFYLCMFGLALGLLFLWVRLYERREFRSLLGETNRPITSALRGVLAGVSLMAGTVLVLALAGATTLERSSGGATGTAALGGVVAAAVLLWAFPAAAEEIIGRGWLLQSLNARRGLVTAIVVSSLVFAMWHWLLDVSLGPLPVTNLALAGIFWSLYALKEGSLVGVCAAHAAYNWAETNLFGFDLYGSEPTGGSLINLKAAGPDVLTGGGIGLNTTGGLAFSIVQVAAIIALLFLIRKTRRQDQ